MGRTSLPAVNPVIILAAIIMLEAGIIFAQNHAINEALSVLLQQDRLIRGLTEGTPDSKTSPGAGSGPSSRPRNGHS